MSKFNRRQFLENLGATGLSLTSTSLLFSQLSTLPLQLMANTLNDQNKKTNFILFRAIGGMDSLLGLHPYLHTTHLPESELFLTYNPTVDVKRNILNTQISLGPSAIDLMPFAQDMLVIRGIVMGASDIGHPAAIQHISSGKPSDASPHVSSIISHALNKNSKYFVTNSVVQKKSNHHYSTIETKSFSSLKLAELPDDNYIRLMSLNKRLLPGVASFLNFLKEKDKLNLFYKILEEIKSKPEKETSSQIYQSTDVSDMVVNLPEDYFLAALVTEYSQVAQIDLVDESKTLDTHGNHYLHLSNQKMRWQRIARFLAQLKKYNVWENTIVMVVSEFNRNPGKNETEGKDHNITDNAVALFGGPVNGGNNIGDHQLHLSKDTLSTSIWTGHFLNYKTGQVVNESTLGLHNMIKSGESLDKISPDIDLIRPENVWATILNYIDKDYVKLISENVKIIPGVFRG